MNSCVDYILYDIASVKKTTNFISNNSTYKNMKTSLYKITLNFIKNEILFTNKISLTTHFRNMINH